MAGPIGYTPPANPYSAMPIEPNSFHGLNPLPGMAAASAAMAPAEAEIQKSEAFDTQAAQAAKFQKLLQSGQQGMQSYIQDVQKTNPELAAQFTQEFNTVAPFMQNLKGKELTDFAFNTYDSWNGRVGAQKMSSYIAKNPAAPMTDLLGQAGPNISPEKQLTLKGADDTRQTNAKLAQSKIDWYTQLPQLKMKIQESQNASRERMTQFRAEVAAKKGKVSPASAKLYLEPTLAEIKSTHEMIAFLEDQVRTDATMASVNQVPGTIRGYQTRLKELEDDRDEYQKVLGSGGLPGTPGPAPTDTSAVTTPTAAGVMPSDDDIKAYLTSKNQPVTPANIAFIKASLQSKK